MIYMVNLKALSERAEPVNVDFSFKSELQNLRVESSDREGHIRVIGSVVGSRGFANGGEVEVIYGEESHINHLLDPGATINLNHRSDAVVGEIVGTSVNEESSLVVDMQFFPKYSFMAKALREGGAEGVSIEAVPSHGVWITDNQFLATAYVLTAIATLFAVTPACPAEQCHVLSENVLSADVSSYLEQLSKLSVEELVQFQKDIAREKEERKIIVKEKAEQEDTENTAVSEESLRKMVEDILSEKEQTRPIVWQPPFDSTFNWTITGSSSSNTTNSTDNHNDS